MHGNGGRRNHHVRRITDLDVDARKVEDVATKGGRQRWHIENQGFNRQKNSGLNLEHVFSTDPERLKAYYYLLQIAHIILQILEVGSLLAPCGGGVWTNSEQLFGSLKNLARRLLEAFRYIALSDKRLTVAEPAHSNSVRYVLVEAKRFSGHQVPAAAETTEHPVRDTARARYPCALCRQVNWGLRGPKSSSNAYSSRLSESIDT